MTPTTTAPPVIQMSDGIELKFVQLDDIYIDRYQRPLDERWLAKREGKTDLGMLGTLILSDRPREGKTYSAIDGQHRIELMLRHGMTEWVAIVFTGMTIEQEAEQFTRFQKERRNITSIQQHQADLIAKNPRAVAIQKIVNDAGFALGPQEGAGSIKAVVLLGRIYDEDPAQLKQVLRLVRDTWGDLPYAQNERILKGVWTFAKQNPDLDEARFVNRLSALSPMVIAQRADQLRQGRGMSSGLPSLVAEVIENAYHSRARAK